MNVSYEFKWNPKTKKGLERIPDDILYEIAKQTLDYATPHIPKSVGKKTSGQLRTSSVAGGVRGSNGDFYIGSYTGYASRVWKFNDSTTNWSTPDTHSQWYAYALKKYGRTIIDIAINKSWKKDM